MKPVSSPACSLILGIAFSWIAFPNSTCGQLVLSGYENKLDASDGDPRVVPNPSPDTVTLLDFTSFPPAITHITNIANSVIGPPSNIAIHPNGRMALVASSIRIPTATATHWVPDSRIYILGSSLAPGDPLRTEKAHLVILERQGMTFLRRQRLEIPPIPSGAVFTGDGRYLVVQCSSKRELLLFAVHDSRVQDTGSRIRVPGMPASIRAGPKP
jgi:hypothetical protein